VFGNRADLAENTMRSIPVQENMCRIICAKRFTQ